MIQNIHRKDWDDHGHVLFVYENHGERLKVLAEYFAEGLANHELCIFVTPDPPAKVMEDFLSAGLDISHAVKEKDLRIFEMDATYLPHGKFVGNHMLTNVINYLIDARSNGYKGLRTAGEMAWLYDSPESLDGAAHYEEQITGLQTENPEFTGLCLYPVREGSGEVMDSALHTHPSFIYDGTARTNPFSMNA